MPYLDKDGLATLWAKVKNTFALKSHSHTASDLPTATTSARGCVQVGDGLSITSAGVLSATGGAQTAKIWTGKCSDDEGGGSEIKIVVLDDETGFPDYGTEGTRIAVTFTDTNNVDYFQLLIVDSNGTPIWEPSFHAAYVIQDPNSWEDDGATSPYGTWAAGETVLFTFNGTRWLYSPAFTAAYAYYLASKTSGSSVSGVKGNAESSYRTGNVNLTAANIVAAASSHTHAAGNITSGTLSAARGGTGQTTLQATRNAMGLGNTTGALPIANGGTGSTTAANARSALGITPANIGAPVAPTNLYTNTSGTSGSFTLSSSIANFSVIEVFFKTNDGCMGCQKIWNNYSSSAKFDLYDNHPYMATQIYLKCAHWSISGTSVSVSNPAEVCLNNGDAVLAYSLAAGIKITRVVGWKY